MAKSEKVTVTVQEVLVSSLAQTDALAKLLIDKSVITQAEFLAKIAQERATYRRMLNPIQHLQTYPRRYFATCKLSFPYGRRGELLPGF